MGGEKLGIPTWFPAQPLSTCQLMGLCPIGPGCEFGICQLDQNAVTLPRLIGGCAALPGCQDLVIGLGTLGLLLVQHGHSSRKPRTTENDEKCDAQYDLDVSVCRNLKEGFAVKNRCYKSAATRYGECLSSGTPRSPLVTW